MGINVENLFGIFLIGISFIIFTLLGSNNVDYHNDSVINESSIIPNINTYNDFDMGGDFDMDSFIETQKYNYRFRSNFDYIHPKFKVFNRGLDSSITNKFIDVIIHYDLDKSDYARKMYTGQILLESGAKQLNSDSSVVVSYAGAVGITQIMPQTCVYYLDKIITYKDSVDFINLGVTDFGFINDTSYSYNDKVEMAIKWLSKVNNNIILWGYITNNELKTTGDIHKQLVSYNAGIGGMRSYVSGGGDVLDHIYINGIRSKLLVASK